MSKTMQVYLIPVQGVCTYGKIKKQCSHIPKEKSRTPLGQNVIPSKKSQQMSHI